MLPPPLPADSPRPPGLIWHQKLLMNPMDSCGVKSVVSGVMGGGMGLMFGMLFSSTPGAPRSRLLPFASLCVSRVSFL